MDPERTALIFATVAVLLLLGFVVLLTMLPPGSA